MFGTAQCLRITNYLCVFAFAFAIDARERAHAKPSAIRFIWTRLHGCMQSVNIKCSIEGHTDSKSERKGDEHVEGIVCIECNALKVVHWQCVHLSLCD